MTKFLTFLKYDFRAFLIVIYQNKCRFSNPEAKLVNKDIFLNENFVFGDSTLFDLTLT